MKNILRLMAPVLICMIGMLSWQIGGYGYPDFIWTDNFFNIAGAIIVACGFAYGIYIIVFRKLLF